MKTAFEDIFQELIQRKERKKTQKPYDFSFQKSEIPINSTSSKISSNLKQNSLKDHKNRFFSKYKELCESLNIPKDPPNEKHVFL